MADLQSLRLRLNAVIEEAATDAATYHQLASALQLSATDAAIRAAQLREAREQREWFQGLIAGQLELWPSDGAVSQVLRTLSRLVGQANG